MCFSCMGHGLDLWSIMLKDWGNMVGECLLFEDISRSALALFGSVAKSSPLSTICLSRFVYFLTPFNPRR